MNRAFGSVADRVNAEVRFHDYRKQLVVTLEASNEHGETYSTTTTLNLSLTEARKLADRLIITLNQAGKLHEDNPSVDVSELKRRIEALEVRFQHTLEVNELWDGS